MTELRLSIVVPAYNEARGIAQSLRCLASHLRAHHSSWEIVVIDDGSTDGTGEISRAALSDCDHIVVERQLENRGKGAAIRRGLQVAGGDVVAFIDADLPFDLTCIEAAHARLARGSDLVIGARGDATGGPHASYAPLRRLFSAGFGFLVAHAFDLGVMDTQCGFKMFRADVGQALFSACTVDRFAFDVEVLVLAKHWGLSMDRVPVSVTRSAKSSVRLVRDFSAVIGDLFSLWRRIRADRIPGRPLSVSRGP